MALYINTLDALKLYRHPEVLWAICRLLLYWISRLWLTPYRGDIEDDPILITIKDPISYAVGGAVVATASLPL